MSPLGAGSLGCLVFLGVACGSSDNQTQLHWKVVQAAEPNVDALGIAGVKVCVDGHSDIPCTTTNADGEFALGFLPTGSDVVLTLEKDGYVPSLKPIETASDVSVEVAQPIAMHKTGDVPTNLGFDVDTKNAGSVDFFVIVLPGDDVTGAGPVPGVTVSLTPAATARPVYFGTPGVLDPTLTATRSSSGSFALGTVTSGRFFNVAAGDYTLKFTPPTGYACKSFMAPNANWGFPVPNQPAVRVPVRDGYNTANVGVSCVATK